MNILNVKENKNVLLSRKELTATISFDSTTPSRKDLIQSLANKYKADEKLVVIKSIKGTFGDRQATVEGCIYDNEEAVKVEHSHNKWRSLPKDKKKELIDAKKKARKDRKKKDKK